MRYEICVRDLTLDEDFLINLPRTDFDSVFSYNHEYIIIDHDNALLPDEYSDIKGLNDFLLFCEEEGISLETLQILSATYLYNEVLEKVKDYNYTIYDVDGEAGDWLIYNEERYGRYMYEQGYNTFPCEVPEKLMDYIDWEANWTSLECDGYRVVCIDWHDYIVR